MDQTPLTPQIPADLPGTGEHRRDLGLREIRDSEFPGMCHGKCPRAEGFPLTSKCPMKETAV